MCLPLSLCVSVDISISDLVLFVSPLYLAPARSFQFLRPYLVGLGTTRTRILFPKMKQKRRHRPLSGDRRPCLANPPLAPMTVRSPSAHSPKSSSRAHAAMQRRYRASSNDSTEDLREAIRHCSRRCSRHLHEKLKRILPQALALQQALQQASQQALPQHLRVCLNALSAGQTTKNMFS